MFGRSDAKRFPRRLKSPADAEQFRRMAWNPSSCAPHPSELLDGNGVPSGGLDVQDCVYQDGALIGVSVSGRAFISRGDDLFSLGPIRDVRLVAVQPFLAELARSSHLAKLRKLDLCGNQIGLSGVMELVASPYLQQLEELDLSRNGLGNEAVTLLVNNKGFGSLRRLTVGDEVSEDSMRMLRERFGAVS